MRSLLLRRAHHHLAELVKVHRPAPVLVQLLDDPVQLVVRQRGQQFPDQPAQRVHRDEALALAIVDPVCSRRIDFELINALS
jgi:hypothetical protein